MSMDVNLSDLIEINAVDQLTKALEDGADINAVDHFGWTALHKAARGGYERLVVFLLKNNADKHIKDLQGYDALFYALTEGHHRIAAILQRNGTGYDQ